MAISTNLGITLIDVSQEDKEGAINNAINDLDTSLSARLVHDMSSDADYTIDTVTDEHYNLIIEITDTNTYLTTSRNIILPNLTQAHIVKNSTLETLVFKTLGGTGVSVISGAIDLIYSNGTNIELVSALSTTGVPHDLHFFYPDTPGNSSIISYLTYMRTVQYSSGLSGSYAKSITAATASSVFSLQKNGIEFATCTFGIGASTGTFSMGSTTTFNAGDTLKIVAPVTADATLSGISINITGTRF